MFTNLFKKEKNYIRFHSLVPGVNTLYPIIHSSKLNRDWVAEEKQEYHRKKSKCPFGFMNPNNLTVDPIHSINKCPAIHGIMNHGFVIRAASDIYVHTNGDRHTINFKAVDLVPHAPHVNVHGNDVSKWLLDSSKDVTLDQILKINTPWRVTTNNNDLVFLVVKTPFVNETRFSPVIGVMDPKIAFEINVQLFWHVLEGDELIKAGTPLCTYIPISRSLLNQSNFVCEDANDIDWKVENEMTYTYDHVDSVRNTLQERVSRVLKVLKKYYD